MKEEMDAIGDNKTWTLCDLPEVCLGKILLPPMVKNVVRAWALRTL
jgi:hypothetical protein